MTPDEIIRELREDADWCDANEYDVPLCMGDNQRAAADLIESLQAQLSAKEAINQAYSATVSLLETDKAELVEQLSVSQAREQAAVELIGKVSQAVEVAFNATDYVKPNTGIWHTLGLALDWIKAWRGPQEALKGETELKRRLFGKFIFQFDT